MLRDVEAVQVRIVTEKPVVALVTITITTFTLVRAREASHARSRSHTEVIGKVTRWPRRRSSSAIPIIGAMWPISGTDKNAT